MKFYCCCQENSDSSSDIGEEMGRSIQNSEVFFNFISPSKINIIDIKSEDNIDRKTKKKLSNINNDNIPVQVSNFDLNISNLSVEINSKNLENVVLEIETDTENSLEQNKNTKIIEKKDFSDEKQNLNVTVNEESQDIKSDSEDVKIQNIKTIKEESITCENQNFDNIISEESEIIKSSSQD